MHLQIKANIQKPRAVNCCYSSKYGYNNFLLKSLLILMIFLLSMKCINLATELCHIILMLCE